jgi:hypothetical protein
MSMTAFHLNLHLKPLRLGDLDGLCGVYAILNALQSLLPKDTPNNNCYEFAECRGLIV